MHLINKEAREAKRLEAVHKLKILDTPADDRYDSVTEFASDLLDVPICFIAILDSKRQWFKSSVGLTIKESTRDISICTHALEAITSRLPEEKIFYVPKLQVDERFCDNPFVTGECSARTYISYVLQSESGENVGTFCIIDTKEREFDQADQLKIMMIGTVVENILYGRDYMTGIEGAVH